MILLDSHIVLTVLGLADIKLTSEMHREMTNRENVYVSVASIWELAIKFRLGKLGLSVPPQFLAELLERLNIEVLPVQARHAVADVGSEPVTKDPFDRLLLGVCAAEGLKLLTVDQELLNHPLAWRS